MDVIMGEPKKEEKFQEDFYQNVINRLAEKDEIVKRIKEGSEQAIKELAQEGKISGNWDTKYIRLSIYSEYIGDKYPDNTAKYLYYIPAINYHFQGNPEDIPSVLQYLTERLKVGGLDKLYQKMQKAIQTNPILAEYKTETAYIVSCLFTDTASRLLDEYLVYDEIPQELQIMYDKPNTMPEINT